MSLEGVRVALLESRMGSELAQLVQKHGGIPTCVPAVQERPLECTPQVAALLHALHEEPGMVIVFSTGVGVRGLLENAEKLGRKEELKEGLRRCVTVCRGPKPIAVLHREGISCSFRVPEPHTTTELTATLGQIKLEGRQVALVHYGERNLPLLQFLESARAKVLELLLYEWLLPTELGPLEELIQQLVASQFRAIAFTSQIQVRHLFEIASRLGKAEALREVLGAKMTIAAIGPTCETALHAQGLQAHVVPEHPKMGPLVIALGRHLTVAPPSEGA